MKVPFSETELNALIKKAVKFYWATRKAQATRQRKHGKKDAGTRGQVTGGKHLDGFANLILQIGKLAGFREDEISLNTAIPIPGYYRPQKNWDVVFMRNGKLVAAIELKSQSGSFGNNFNNRSEEVIGVSKDFWVAYREKAFGVSSAPWLGYLFFLEDSEAANRPIRLAKSPLPPLKVFEGASYRRRYEILCERLVLERDYSATALVVSGKDGSVENGSNPAVSAFSFFRSLFLHLSSFS